MKALMVSLNSIDKVKSFCNEIAKFDAEFDLISGRYVIDAKSIMGIFSLDISKPIELNIHADKELDDILAAIKPYIVE
jgi:phosphotransferase system HPr-like phosphotransfer protein